jgi:putative thioredoxin
VPVTDVDEATFEHDVIERSRERPVVVDFWAAWCGPCRQLGPLLEQAADARDGDVELVKVDVDRNPSLAASFGVQGIPAVKAFSDGRVVDEFVGALPRPQVEAFFDALVPSEADQLVAVGDEESLKRAIELDPRRADARVALAHVLLGRGQTHEALELLRPVSYDAQATGLLARAELAADPEAPEAVRDALTALSRGEVEPALDGLLAAAAEARGELRDGIRRVMIGVFGELGDTHPLTVAYRRRLASALY